jgi:hypothetical protein
MEMIGHHTISDHPHPAEPLINPHQPHKLLPLLIPENKVSVHHPGDAVVESSIGKRVGRSLETTLAHGEIKSAKARKATFFFIEGQTLYFLAS